MLRICLLGALIAVHGSSTGFAASPQTARPARDPAARTARPYTLTVTLDGGFIDVALEARGAKLSDIADDLAARIGTRVVVGRGLAGETISVALAETSLDAALSSLAPHVLVDYLVRRGAPPAPQAIYLLGPGDADPPTNTVERGVSQGVMITGDTEQTSSASDDPLQIVRDRHFLRVISKQQPLAIVAFALADVLGVPLEIDGAGTELVDADLQNVSAEDAVASLSPNLRLFVRVEVVRLERTPLRLVVARPGDR